MIEWLITVFDAIQTNPIVAGLFGTTLIGGVVAYCRNIPNRLYDLFYNFFTVTINIYETEDKKLYYIIDKHLSIKQLYTLNKNYGIIRKSQQDWFSGTNGIAVMEMIQENVTYDGEQDAFPGRLKYVLNYIRNHTSVGVLQTGHSKKNESIVSSNDHYLRLISNVGNSYYCKFGDFWCTVRKNVDESNKLVKTGIYRITFFTRNINCVHRMLSDLVAEYEKEEEECKQRINIRDGQSWLTVIKDKTDNNIFLPTEETESIYKKVAHFLNNKQSYKERSKVYREGFLLYGIPGCGKTHFIQQLANDFELELYVINLNDFNSDKNFISAMLDINYPSIVVFEDVDAMNTKINRKTLPNKPQQNKKIDVDCVQIVEAEEEEFYVGNGGVSISAILNVFDGIYSQEGQLIFATTNYQDQLDPAFVRAGRFNTKVEFGYMSRYEICLKLKTYYKGETSEIALKDNIYITIADLMKCCIDNERLEDCIKEINTYVVEKGD